MYFHIIGIKEVDNKKYSIDMVFEFESQSNLKDFLRSQNVIILDFKEYKQSDFGNAYVLLIYKQNRYKVFFNTKNILSSVKDIVSMNFYIDYFNFTIGDEWSDSKVYNALQTIYGEVQAIDTLEVEQQIHNKQTTNLNMNNRLDKTINIVTQTLLDVNKFLESIDTLQITSKKIRDIKSYIQELTKIKMGRNIDKMLDLLEKVYHTIYDIREEYLLNQESASFIKKSIITNTDVFLEFYKNEKAQNIKEIGKKRTSTESYYIFLKDTGIYFRLLLKDLRFFVNNKYKIFLIDYIEILFIFIILMASILSRFLNIFYLKYQSSNLYYLLIQTGIYGFVFYISKLFVVKKKKGIIFAILVLSMIVSYILFLQLKNNLSF